LRIQAKGRGEFGTLAPHNFGSNTAGTLRKFLWFNHTRGDIVVLVNGSYVCGEEHGDGGYSVTLSEGNVCSTQCSAQLSCKCPL
jgi:hypothetical protein